MAGSETEIRSREGFPYGGLPHDALLYKLEETDPDLVAEVRGADPLADPDEAYRNYVRAEAIDWTPDAPYLESDHPTRDPGGLSRSRLNLIYNGTRGSNPELPRHPEMFFGFTENDPRGALLDPRFDSVRGHVTSRAADLTARMGNNDDNDVAERPWTNQSISYGMKEVQRRLKNSTRVFSTQKEGRPWGRNTVARELGLGGDPRAWTIGVGAESLGGPGARFVSGDHGGADRPGVGRPAGCRATGDESGPWRHTTRDAPLGGQRRAGPRPQAARLEAGRLGGGAARATGAEHGWTEAATGRAANRQLQAAAGRQAVRARTASEQSLGRGRLGAPRGPGAGGVAHDSGRVWRASAEDQGRQSGPGELARLGHSAGLVPAARPEQALRRSRAEASPGSFLADVASAVAGVREGSAAAFRRVAGLASAAGARFSGPSEAPGRALAGAVPGDAGRATRASSAALVRPGASEGVAPAFAAAAPGRPEARVAAALDAFDPRTWRAQAPTQRVGGARAPDWRAARERELSELGASDSLTFGPAGEGRGAGAAPVGPKSLRAGGWSVNARLADDGPGFDA